MQNETQSQSTNLFLLSFLLKLFYPLLGFSPHVLGYVPMFWVMSPRLELKYKLEQLLIEYILVD